ncbi:MAG: DNA repair protein RecO [Planctomycetaceae bacterium]|jgi:DNA repair protein RecO (recombination protein O)|nr:DNA repair protein RecO [Planctomycetaceae bacterium]
MPNADAFVLRTVDYSETSSIVTLYSRQYGKIEGLAKGGRRLKSSFENALDLLTRIKLSFIQKKGDVLDLLTESKLVRRFPVNETNIAGLFGGYYVAELLNKFTQPGIVNPPLYDVSVRLLNRLERGTSVMRGLIRYEGLLLQLTGHQPSLHNCVECGQKLDLIRYKYWAFSPLHGGVVCSRCVEELQQTGAGGMRISVSTDALTGLETLSEPKDRSEHWAHLPLEKGVLNEIRNLNNYYISCLLGRKPRLFDWFGYIAKNDNETV